MKLRVFENQKRMPKTKKPPPCLTVYVYETEHVFGPMSHYLSVRQLFLSGSIKTGSLPLAIFGRSMLKDNGDEHKVRPAFSLLTTP
jgi:hypothetical protein